MMMRFPVSASSANSLFQLGQVSRLRGPIRKPWFARLRFIQPSRVSTAAQFSTGSGNHICGATPTQHGHVIKRPWSTCTERSHRLQIISNHSRPLATTATNEGKDTAEHYEFMAETSQLLDIVTHSLYTDKEVFLRELVSNASDACEKLRHIQAANEAKTIDPDLPLEIHITTDEVQQTLTISDTGIGLTKDEMIKNLGTIARSGSKAFVHSLNAKVGTDPSDVVGASQGIIGRFGVGFYSSFMVGKNVDVQSRSAIQSDTEQPSHVWTSTGTGSFDVAELPSDMKQNRGSSVIIHLKDECCEYASEKHIEAILNKYSNFVNFPIYLNGKRVNSMEAVWSKEPNSVDDDTHNKFYKFIAKAFDEPLTHLHFRADAPLEVKALLYVPSFHSEKHGMGRMAPGVSLYCRKVLIEANSTDILPDWLRFVRGVVDSEDLPLSISREKAQDTSLIRKLKRVLTRKLISHFATMARKEPEKYKFEFWKEYGYFLKEGICQDYEFQDQLSKLLYFETSKTMDGELSSLEEYVSRCKPDQKEIYYLCAPSRELALDSPYLEMFEKSDREVIFVFSAIDDFVMSNLSKFQDRAIVSAEKGDLEVGSQDEINEAAENAGDSTSQGKLTSAEADAFCVWFHMTMQENVERVKVTNRLGNSPAIITNHESGALRRMMRMVDTSQQGASAAEALPKQTVEVNPAHPIIVGLNEIRMTQPKVAEVCAKQIYDNCLVAAGLLDDGRSMLPRLNDLLLCVLKGASQGQENLDCDAETSAPTLKS